MTYLQAIVLGLTQGITELFPISSLGHAVLVPQIFGWHLQMDNSFFLSFLVATHLATATVLVIFFWRDWVGIVRGLARSVATRRVEPSDTNARLGWLLVIGTVPAAMLGFLLQRPIEGLFSSPVVVSLFLVANGVVLFAAELLRSSAPRLDTPSGSDERISRLSWARALGVGLAQSLALIPGFSRSGTTMAGGLLAGLSNEDAARFSFLLATPVIAAATLLKAPGLFAPSQRAYVGPVLVGALCAALGAYVSTRFLLRFFERNRLWPFAIYCVVVGLASAIFFLVR